MLYIPNLIAIMDVSLSEEDDYEQLITRANSYEKAECDSNETNTKSTPKKTCTKYFFKCQEHDDKKEWSTDCAKCALANHVTTTKSCYPKNHKTPIHDKKVQESHH